VLTVSSFSLSLCVWLSPSLYLRSPVLLFFVPLSFSVLFFSPSADALSGDGEDDGDEGVMYWLN